MVDESRVARVGEGWGGLTEPWWKIWREFGREQAKAKAKGRM